ncbi:hypothetical protein D3C87_1957930 [compost metagenome]
MSEHDQKDCLHIHRHSAPPHHHRSNGWQHYDVRPLLRHLLLQNRRRALAHVRNRNRWETVESYRYHCQDL